MYWELFFQRIIFLYWVPTVAFRSQTAPLFKAAAKNEFQRTTSLQNKRRLQNTSSTLRHRVSWFHPRHFPENPLRKKGFRNDFKVSFYLPQLHFQDRVLPQHSVPRINDQSIKLSWRAVGETRTPGKFHKSSSRTAAATAELDAQSRRCYSLLLLLFSKWWIYSTDLGSFLEPNHISCLAVLVEVLLTLCIALRGGNCRGKGGKQFSRDLTCFAWVFLLILLFEIISKIFLENWCKFSI